MSERRHDTMLLTGNHAVAWGARLARPKVAPGYPITPQTPILEKLTEFQAALGLVQLGRMGDILAARCRLAEAYRQFVWALMTSAEFRFNH